MIGLLTFAIVVCILFLTVEIPVFIKRREYEDLLIIITSCLMLAACIAVLSWGPV